MATFRTKRANVAENCILHSEDWLWIPLAKWLETRNPLSKFDGQVIRCHPRIYSVAMLFSEP